MFRLRKWYMDLVTAEGEVWIGYAGKATFWGLSVGYSALLSGGKDRAVGKAVWPEMREGSLMWKAKGLGVTMEMAPEARGFGTVLMEAKGDRIEWQCRVPRGRVVMEAGGRTVEGTGYGEELTMTVAPWRLPFETMRWGRFHGSGRTVVWIEWKGTTEGTWVYLDGEAVAGRVSDNEVTWGGGRLRMEQVRVVREGNVVEETWPWMTKWKGLLPNGLGNAREVKWLGRGRLACGEEEEEEGWVLQEVVQWR